jgi:hypothetical protein
MPAKAGIQKYLKTLDSRLRGNDTEGHFKTLYGFIIINCKNMSFDNMFSLSLNLNSPLLGAGNSNYRYRSLFGKTWSLNPMGLRTNSEIPCSDST